MATPVDDPEGWEWNSNKYLIDYVIAIEVDLGLRLPPKLDIPVLLDEESSNEPGQGNVEEAVSQGAFDGNESGDDESPA